MATSHSVGMELFKMLQQVIYIFFYLLGKQNGACNLLHGEVILNGLNRKQTEFIAVQESYFEDFRYLATPIVFYKRSVPNIYCVVHVMDIQQYITVSKVRRRT
ncbi:hypothetical protein NQ315_014680 [Exocentrus adspersus]|uniref:Uncharacterized protein n=1 Tax=Exocentrus adspersus TaxID=1586481 RepID=A0AAV8VQE4_9CUCU|nr:hypothetical protein NQ315_014680 [Exocentrus adspersus]